jgi:phosphotriesterase-related protein
VAERGAYVAVDHVGSEGDGHVTDKERVALVLELIAAGHADRILLSCSATNAAFGHPAVDTPYSHVLTTFAPTLRAEGVSEDDVQRILVANPRALLTVKEH